MPPFGLTSLDRTKTFVNDTCSICIYVRENECSPVSDSVPYFFKWDTGIFENGLKDSKTFN